MNTEYKQFAPMRFLEMELSAGRNIQKETNVLSRLGMDAKVSFSVTQSVSGAVAEAKISVYGLAKDKMAYLATSVSPWQTERIYNRMVITAGTESCSGLIFDGEIIEAVPDLSDMGSKIDLTCLSYYKTMLDNPKSYTFKGAVSVRRIAEKLAQDLNVGFVDGLGLTGGRQITGYSEQNKSIIDHMRALSQMAELDIWAAGGRLFIKQRASSLPGLKVLDISASKNMIGNPEPTDTGCRVKIKMTPSVLPGQEVCVDSSVFPVLNSGNFVVQTLEHAGDTMGGQWETTLTLIRKNIYE